MVEQVGFHLPALDALIGLLVLPNGRTGRISASHYLLPFQIVSACLPLLSPEEHLACGRPGPTLGSLPGPSPVHNIDGRTGRFPPTCSACCYLAIGTCRTELMSVSFPVLGEPKLVLLYPNSRHWSTGPCSDKHPAVWCYETHYLNGYCDTPEKILLVFVGCIYR